jgi:carboxyl-terminal processing protease
LFQQVLTHVQRFGVDSLSERELYERAADGLVRELNDEYAALLPATAGGLTPGRWQPPADLGGLGLLLSTRGGRAAVLGVVPGSPADVAGLRAGDHLVEVDGVSTDPIRHDQLVALLEGRPGSAVVLRVRRPGIGVLATWRLVRRRASPIHVSPAVTLDSGVGYLAVGRLRSGAAEVVRSRVAELRRSGVSRLVLDLRGSAEGELEEAVRVAGLFLDRGAEVVEIRGRIPPPKRLATRDQPVFAKLPLVVLIDAGTADAAEALAGALQDHDRALLVGQPTFGRGLSPEVFPLDDTLAIRLSTGRWFTPAGRSLSVATVPPTLSERPETTTYGGRRVRGGGGVVPDSMVPLDTLPDVSRELMRALDAGLPDYYRVVSAVGEGIARAGGVAVGFQPRPEHLERLFTALARAGLGVPRQAYDAAGPRVGRDLSDAAVRAALGEAGLLRHRAERDPVVRMARELLAGAGTVADLIGLPPAIAAPPAPRAAPRT